MDSTTPVGASDQNEAGPPTSTASSPSSSVVKLTNPPEGHHEESWDDIRGYMKAKRRKLDTQFQHMSGNQQTEIFKGVTIYVNGWTQPDADELKRLMHLHGGHYVYNTWSGAKVTHVIATNLPNVKVRNIGDTLVCSPEWIVDSIAVGKLLSVERYRLYSQNGSRQRQLRFKKTEAKNEREKDTTVSGSIPTSVAVEEVSNPLNDQAVSIAGSHAEATVPQGQQSMDHEMLPPTSPPSAPSRSIRAAYHSSRGADFVEEFYTHSRLHYLSTWSSELKQFTSQLLAQIQPSYPKLPPSASLRALKLRAVVHVDIDCFFVSVSIRDRPHLRGKPVAVTHAKGKGKERAGHDRPKKGGGIQRMPTLESSSHSHSELESATGAHSLEGKPDADDAGLSSTSNRPEHLLRSVSDIASCSYEARRAGVCNGMWVGEALKLCPELELVPYDFDSYYEVSREFYKTLLGYSSTIEPVSCDEVYIELTDYAESMEKVNSMVQALRDEVRERTGCSASAGISHNMLLARMATRLAKPNGQFYLPRDTLQDFLSPQPVHDLPGVGYSTSQKLREMHVETCSQLKNVPLSKLQAEFGAKTGRMLHDYSRGIDSRELRLEPERKSLSADINFGIRFTDSKEAESFLTNLATEVQRRAEEAQVLANSVTLKLKVRKPEASMQPKKFLGHGICDNVSRSHSFPHPTRSATEIAQVTAGLLKQLKVSPTDIRGVGIQLNKLVPGLQSNGRASSVDIRTMMSKSDPTPLASHAHGGRKSHTHSTNPPLPRLITQSPEKGLYAHPGTCSSEDLRHRPEVDVTVNPSVTTTAAITAARPPPGTELDESFAVDLPPASQLDPSVLDALPPSLKDKIIRSYSKSENGSRKEAPSHLLDQPGHSRTIASSTTELPKTTPVQDSCALDLEQDSGRHMRLVSRSADPQHAVDDDSFLPAFRAYLKDWVDHFPDGPKDQDIEKVANYLLEISGTNLTIVLSALQYLRRLLTRLELTDWYGSFNLLLAVIQGEVRERYLGTLPVREIMPLCR